MSACLLAMQSLAQTEQTFSLVTSQSELNTTDKYVIALQPAKSGAVQYGLYAMGNAKSNGKGFEGVEITPDITALPATFTTAESLTTISLVEGSGDNAGSYALKAEEGYLSWTTVKQMNYAETADGNYAAVAFEGNSVIIKNGANSIQAALSNGAGGVKGSVTFNTYATAQKPVALYVLKSGDIPDNPEKVPAPTFELVKSSDRLGTHFAVEMSCTAENAVIYYTISEGAAEPGTPSKENGTLYEAPVIVTPGCKIKAIAYVGDKASDVASYNPEVPYAVNEFQSLLTLTEQDVTDLGLSLVYVSVPVTVAYANGRYIYVMYDEKCMLVYDTKDKYKGVLKAGDVIADITGTFSLYNGCPQISSPELGEITTGGTAPSPKEVKIGDLGFDMLLDYVIVKKVTVADDNGKLSMTDGTTTVAMYNYFTNPKFYDVVTVEPGESMDVTGFVGRYQKKGSEVPAELQLNPVKVEKNTESGLAEIEVSDAKAVYFNLQGVRVEDPDNGIFIEVKNGASRKVSLK